MSEWVVGGGGGGRGGDYVRSYIFIPSIWNQSALPLTNNHGWIGMDGWMELDANEAGDVDY